MTGSFVRKFNRQQWLDSGSFLDRKTIFLDMSFWIGMSEGREPNFIELKELLVQKVTERKIICPVSPSLLLELKKRPSDPKRLQYCQLTEELSQGLSIRNWLAVFEDEFKNVVEGKPVGAQIAYSHFVEAFSGGLGIEFDEEWSQADADKAGELIFEDVSKLAIREVIAMDVDENQQGSIKFLRSGLARLAEQEHAERQTGSESPNAIEQAEFEALVRSVLPQIMNSSARIDPGALTALLTFSDEQKAVLLKQCPTFWCHLKLMTALRSNRQKLKENDFWDLQHAASALPYVTCFACDSGTRHLCSEMLKLDCKYSVTIISEIGELVEWVKTSS